MPRENAHAKARRYLAEVRLTLRQVDADTVTATFRGDGELHHLGWTVH